MRVPMCALHVSIWMRASIIIYYNVWCYIINIFVCELAPYFTKQVGFTDNDYAAQGNEIVF